MATSRRAPAINIYQDPPSSDIQRVEADLLAAFGASVHDVSSALHTSLNPPTSRSSALSPLKTRGRSSSPSAEVFRDANLNTVRFPKPSQTNFITDSPLKRHLQSARPNQHASKPQKALFAQFPSSHSMDKENFYGQGFPTAPTQFSGANFDQKKRKRSVADAGSMSDLASKKQRSDFEPPSDPLPVEDDGQKPPHSYATLIAMAILRAPNRRLTLNQIYNWIKTSFRFYQKTDSKQGWQNSIRHNLSLNKAFTKQERPKDDPGKGSYWVIVPGMEQQFTKEKPARRNTQSEGSSFPNLSSDAMRPSTAIASSAANFSFPPSTSKAIDSSKLPDEAEFSSDATVLASDPAGIHDGQDAEGDGMMLPSQEIRSSPPPAPEMHSSPPQAIMEPPRRKATPQPDAGSTSQSQFSRSAGGRQRKFSALGDSGYYSSIESSVTRNNPHGPLLTSEADLDRSRPKRSRIGDRAEDEIARIRGSSYDSPTKGRVLMRPSTANNLPSSSPFRPFEGAKQAPLTPAVIFKRPAMPPPSVSPNTNLRNHRNRVREMLGDSPGKSANVMRDNICLVGSPFSASFLLPNESFNLAEDSFFSNYDVFSDLANLHTPAARGSPEKRGSSKRPSLVRANTTSGILQDVTGVKSNSLLSLQPPTPDFKKQYLPSPLRFGSPIKGATGEPSKDGSPVIDELFGMNIPSDDADEEGFDILQNFGRIGARMPPPPKLVGVNKENLKSPTKQPGPKPSRPSFARSTTSIF